MPAKERLNPETISSEELVSYAKDYAQIVAVGSHTADDSPDHEIKLPIDRIEEVYSYFISNIKDTKVVTNAIDLLRQEFDELNRKDGIRLLKIRDMSLVFLAMTLLEHRGTTQTVIDTETTS